VTASLFLKASLYREPRPFAQLRVRWHHVFCQRKITIRREHESLCVDHLERVEILDILRVQLYWVSLFMPPTSGPEKVSRTRTVVS
jgi:hypothetical protein